MMSIHRLQPMPLWLNTLFPYGLMIPGPPPLLPPKPSFPLVLLLLLFRL